MPPRGVFAAGPLAAASLWGGMYVVSKWGFAAIPPVTLAFLRVALGAVALLVIVRAAKPSPSFTRREWREFGVLGVLVTVTLVTQFLGTDLTNASQGSLLTVLTPVFTVGLGVALLDESLTARRALGTGLALAGTLLVVAGQYDLGSIASGNVLGVLMLLLGSLGWAAYTVRGAPLVRSYSALEAATYSTLLAVPMLALLVPVELALLGSVPSPAVVTPGVVAAVGYLGLLATAGAWYLWYKGLEYADAGTVAVFFFAQPVVGSLLGAVLLAEAIGPFFLAGGGLMAVGVYAVSTDETS